MPHVLAIPHIDQGAGQPDLVNIHRAFCHRVRLIGVVIDQLLLDPPKDLVKGKQRHVLAQDLVLLARAPGIILGV